MKVYCKSLWKKHNGKVLEEDLRFCTLMVKLHERIELYSFPDMKKRFEWQKPSIKFEMHSCAFELKKLGDKLFFGDIRVPNEEQTKHIQELDWEILQAQERKVNYLKNCFSDFNLLTLEQAKQCVKPERLQQKEENIEIVLKQKKWI